MSLLLTIIILLTSITLIVLVLMHSGSGGGLADMFGGGASDLNRGSANAEKNLTRYTVGLSIIWVASIIALGLLGRPAGL